MSVPRDIDPISPQNQTSKTTGLDNSFEWGFIFWIGEDRTGVICIEDSQMMVTSVKKGRCVILP
jgi:hypothetical protein